jgi:hypothetical protein
MDNIIDPPPVQAGDVIRLEPVFEDGQLAGYAIINASSGELLMMVPKKNVQVAAAAGLVSNRLHPDSPRENATSSQTCPGEMPR